MTYDTSDKEGLERIFGNILNLAWIPNGDFTFQFIGNLFGFLFSTSF